MTLTCPTDEHYELERRERKAAKRRERAGKPRREDGEYSDDSLEDWERSEPRAVKMLEAPASSAGAPSSVGGEGGSQADFVGRNSRRREKERESEVDYVRDGRERRRERDAGGSEASYGRV